MKCMRFFILLVVAALMNGCATPAKMVENRQYDRAIETMSKKLRTGRVSDKSIALLAEAYDAANKRDQDQIAQLRQSGQPDIWSAVYQLYLGLEQRQTRINSLPDQVHQGMDFSLIDFSADIRESQARAAAYLYAKGKKMLESDDKKDAKQAYALFQQLWQIDSTYRDLEKLIQSAIFKGADRALIAFENQTNLPLPQGFMDELMNISAVDLKTDYVQFDVQAIEGQTYDFTVWIKLQQIEVSPEREEQRRFTERKLPGSTEGQVYEQMENHGDRPRMQATINEHIMRKSAQLNASLEIVRNIDEHCMYSVPLLAKSNFEHKYGFVFGSVEAISDETKELIKNEPIPFPSDAIMVLDAARALRQAVIISLWQKSTPPRERANSMNIDRNKQK